MISLVYMSICDTMFIGHPGLDRAIEDFETQIEIIEEYAVSAYSREESIERIFHGRFE